MKVKVLAIPEAVVVFLGLGTVVLGLDLVLLERNMKASTLVKEEV